MLGAYPGLFSPNRTTYNHNRRFRNESDRTRLSKFHCKKLPSNGEAVGHPWLLFLGYRLRPETISPLLQTFLPLRMFKIVYRDSSLHSKHLS